MGRWIGEAGGVDKEEDRVERPEEVQGEAVEGEGEGVVEGVGMVSLGLGRSECGASGKEEDDELDKEGSGVRAEEDEGLGFGVAGLPISDGSIAEKHIGQQISKKKKEKKLIHNHSDIQNQQ